MNAAACTELTTIRLYGEMGRLFGRVHRAALDRRNVGEAVQFLISQFPKVEQYLAKAKDRGIGFSVFYGKYNVKERELDAIQAQDDIRIAPIIMGSKNGGIFSIIAGIVLVAVGAVATYFGFGAVGVPLMQLGGAMIIGGLVQLLTPTPKGLGAKDSAANTPNYSFNGPINTEAQGHPVPYFAGGPMSIGSAVGSAGISVTDVAAAYQPPPSGSGHMGYGGDLYAGTVGVP